MGLIYDEQLSIKTSLTLNEAVSKLARAIEPHPAERGYSQAGYAFDNLGRYVGGVSADGFSLHRRRRLSEVGRVNVEGKFNHGPGGVKIHVRMAPPVEARVFAAAWYALVLIILAASLIRWFRSGMFDAGVIVAILFGLVFYLIFLVGRMRERGKAVRFLRILYQD